MVYIACFLVSISLSYAASRSKNKGVIFLCSLLCILIPCILGGLMAHGIGTDTRTYGRPDCDAALHSSSFDAFRSVCRREWGYGLLCYTVMNTLGSENWCYFFYQLITISCFYIGAYKHRKNISLPMIMTVWFLMFYNTTYNNMRQNMAGSIIFMGFNNIEEKKYLRFLPYVFFATFFHRSAAITIVLLVAMHYVMTSDFIKKNIWTKILVFYGSAGGLLLTRTIIAIAAGMIPLLSRYIHYLNNKYNEVQATAFMALIMFAEIIMLTLYRRKAARTLKGDSFCRNNIEFYRFNLVFCLIFQLFVKFFIERVLFYSELVNVLVLAAMPRFVKEKYFRAFVMVSVLFVMAFYWLWLFVRGNNSRTWPYKSIIL